MLSMWERRLLTALIVIGLAAVGALLGIRGYGVFAYIGVSVLLAMSLGLFFEGHLQTRQRARSR
jgi:hypothetical protein